MTDRVREVEVRPGLDIHIVDNCSDNDVSIHYELPAAPVAFGFLISGKVRNHIRDNDGKHRLFNGKQGDCGVSYFPRATGVCEYTCREHIQIIHIVVAHWLLDELMAGTPEKITADFYPVLNQKVVHYYKKESLSSDVQTALVQLLGCQFTGTAQKIYLESKALELVALQMNSLIFDYSSGAGPRALNRSETDRIYEARQIISSRYMDPPSLGELSRQVGLNEFKLKRGFQNIFKNTVFGCLLDCRMAHARMYLEEGKKSVKEIAHAVGYQSPSRFSDAFKRKFGVRPTHYSPS